MVKSTTMGVLGFTVTFFVQETGVLYIGRRTSTCAPTSRTFASEAICQPSCQATISYSPGGTSESVNALRSSVTAQYGCRTTITFAFIHTCPALHFNSTTPCRCIVTGMLWFWNGKGILFVATPNIWTVCSTGSLLSILSVPDCGTSMMCGTYRQVF